MHTTNTKWLSVADTVLEAMVNDLESMISCPSINPPGDEAPVASYLAGALTEMGAEVSLLEVCEGRPNVIGVWRFGPGPVVLLTSHMDVVPAPEAAFRPHRLNQRIYGRGACDAKGCLAALLGACRIILLRGKPQHGTLVFAATIGEEVDGAGTEHLARAGLVQLNLTASSAILGEPTGSQIVLGCRGGYGATIIFHGKLAHTSNPVLGVNAIYHAARFISAVEEMDKEFSTLPFDPLYGPPTICATVVHGGTKSNVVPDRCEVQFGRRTCPGETIKLVEAEIVRLIDKVRTFYPSLQVDISALVGHDPVFLETAHPLAVAALSAATTALGTSASPAPYWAGTDLTYLTRNNIPGIILGPGHIDQAHTVDEYVEEVELVRTAAVAAALVHQLLTP